MPALPAGAESDPELWLDEPWAWVVPVRWFVNRHPLLVDACAALAFAALTAIPLIYGERRWWVWLLDVALIVPLILRRRRPFAVFCVIAGIAFIQWLADVPLASDAALLVALYTVA